MRKTIRWSVIEIAQAGEVQTQALNLFRKPGRDWTTDLEGLEGAGCTGVTPREEPGDDEDGNRGGGRHGQERAAEGKAQGAALRRPRLLHRPEPATGEVGRGDPAALPLVSRETEEDAVHLDQGAETQVGPLEE